MDAVAGEREVGEGADDVRALNGDDGAIERSDDGGFIVQFELDARLAERPAAGDGVRFEFGDLQRAAQSASVLVTGPVTVIWPLAEASKGCWSPPSSGRRPE